MENTNDILVRIAVALEGICIYLRAMEDSMVIVASALDGSEDYPSIGDRLKDIAEVISFKGEG